MERFAFFMPRELKTRLQRLAKRTGLGLADLIRRAVEDYLTKNGL